MALLDRRGSPCSQYSAATFTQRSGEKGVRWRPARAGTNWNDWLEELAHFSLSKAFHLRFLECKTLCCQVTARSATTRNTVAPLPALMPSCEVNNHQNARRATIPNVTTKTLERFFPNCPPMGLFSVLLSRLSPRICLRCLLINLLTPAHNGALVMEAKPQ